MKLVPVGRTRQDGVLGTGAHLGDDTAVITDREVSRGLALPTTLGEGRPTQHSRGRHQSRTIACPAEARERDTIE